MRGCARLESDLAHMNRLSMMGELTASLAHEITQPIASARNNARAATEFFGQAARQTWARSGKRSTVSWAMPIEPETSSTGSVITSRKRLRERRRFDLNKAIERGDRIGAKRNHQEWSLGPDPPYGGVASRPGGSCSTATSRPELDPERGRSHEHGRGGATRVVDQHRANPDRWRSRGRARFRAGH